MSENQTTSQGQTSLLVLKDLLTGMSWFALTIGALIALGSFVHLSASGGHFASGPAGWDDPWHTAMAAVLFIAATAVLFVLVVWVYKMNAACHDSGAKGMKFTPGWSAGWFFIPIANLWMPFLVVREIWQVRRNPSNWSDESTSPLLGWWWACLLLEFIYVKRYLLTMLFDLDWSVPGDDPIRISLLLSLMSGILLVSFCATTMTLVSKLTLNQAKPVGQ